MHDCIPSSPLLFFSSLLHQLEIHFSQTTWYQSSSQGATVVLGLCLSQLNLSIGSAGPSINNRKRPWRMWKSWCLWHVVNSQQSSVELSRWCLVFVCSQIWLMVFRCAKSSQPCWWFSDNAESLLKCSEMSWIFIDNAQRYAGSSQI